MSGINCLGNSNKVKCVFQKPQPVSVTRVPVHKIVKDIPVWSDFEPEKCNTQVFTNIGRDISRRERSNQSM